MSNFFAVRRYTAAAWPGATILWGGQLGYETDTEKFKMGDGATAWSSLPYLSASAFGGLAASNNLSDVASASTSRANLGLGTAAVVALTTLLQVSNNLSDLGSASTARTNLGLGTVATQAAPPSSSAMLKGNGSGGFAAATAGTDYVAPWYAAITATPVSVTNTTTETVLWTPGTDSATFTSGVSALRMRVGGTFSTGISSGTMTLRLRQGSGTSGTTLLTLPVVATSTTAAHGPLNWWADFDILVQTAGSSGALSIVGWMQQATGTAAAMASLALFQNTTGLNIASGLQLTLTGQWSAAVLADTLTLDGGVIQQIA